MRHQRFPRDDDGAPDPHLRGLIAAATADQRAYLRCCAGLGLARLLLPVVPQESSEPDIHDEPGTPLVVFPDGRRALMTFTGLDSLQAWQADARPVQCTIDEVARTAQQWEADGGGAVTVVVDPAGPVALELVPQVVTALAAGQRLVELEDGQFGWLSG